MTEEQGVIYLVTIGGSIHLKKWIEVGGAVAVGILKASVEMLNMILTATGNE